MEFGLYEIFAFLLCALMVSLVAFGFSTVM